MACFADMMVKICDKTMIQWMLSLDRAIELTDEANSLVNIHN